VNLILFDCHKTRENLLPLTYTRPTADLRVGIITIREKWEKLLGQKSFTLTENYLQEKYPSAADNSPSLYINGSVLPDSALVETIKQLGALQCLASGETVVAFKTEKTHLNYENFEAIIKSFSVIQYARPLTAIQYPWDIFKQNADAIKSDFILMTKGRQSQPLSTDNRFAGSAENIFIEPGAKVQLSILNASDGPIYVGADAEVMENCTIRGPFSLGEHSTLKMAAKIYGGTTIGPHCKVGGEVSNAIFTGYSNKAHDGFLGNAVIGEWCNLGADTNNSNLKNNYAEVEVFNYREGKAVKTGLTFCGLIMGDHAKSGINTMFNTGSVVGVSANVFDGGFPPKFIPSFSWGGAKWLKTFNFDKGMEVAAKMMERRGLTLADADIKILKTVFERDEQYRRKFN
jgi:UDP-N-acetylglucosamine diphosphorylase/glucosamine-1-phosphate N-acetyltransferase